METGKDVEPKQPERVISIGEEFSPFDPKYTHKERGPSVNEFISKITLKTTPEDGDISFDIAAWEDGNAKDDTKDDVITPFDPKEGYPVSSKKSPSDRELRKKINFRKAPLTFGITEDVSETSQIDRESLSGFLKVVLTFPNQEPFEGRPQGVMKNAIDFDEFYPVSTIEPSVIDDELAFRLHEYKIRLPSDLNKLSQMRAKFVRAEKQPKET